MNANRTFTRLLALVMAAVLTLGCISITASAATQEKKEVTVYFFYYHGDYVETTVMVDKNATHVPKSVLEKAAREAGIVNGMGQWYIHGSYNNKISAGANADGPGFVWANVRCTETDYGTPIYPATTPYTKTVKVKLYYADSYLPAGEGYLSVNDKTVLVDINEVAKLALEMNLELVDIDRKIDAYGEVVGYVRNRQVFIPNATQSVNIKYYIDDVPTPGVSYVVVPKNTTVIDESVIIAKRPDSSWMLDSFQTRIQDGPDGPFVSATGYISTAGTNGAVDVMLSMDSMKGKTSDIENYYNVKKGGTIELPEIPTYKYWKFKGWTVDDTTVLKPGKYNINDLFDYTTNPNGGTLYITAVYEEVEVKQKEITFNFVELNDKKATKHAVKKVSFREDITEIDPLEVPVLRETLEWYKWIPVASKIYLNSKTVTLYFTRHNTNETTLTVNFVVDPEKGYIEGAPADGSFKPDDDVRFPAVTAHTGHTFVEWVDADNTPYSPGTVKASDIFDFSVSPYSGSMTFRAVFDDVPASTRQVTVNFREDSDTAPVTTTAVIAVEQDAKTLNVASCEEIQSVLDTNHWKTTMKSLNVSGSSVDLIYTREIKNVKIKLCTDYTATPKQTIPLDLPASQNSLDVATCQEIQLALKNGGWRTDMTTLDVSGTEAYLIISDADRLVTVNFKKFGTTATTATVTIPVTSSVSTLDPSAYPQIQLMLKNYKWTLKTTGAQPITSANYVDLYYEEAPRTVHVQFINADTNAVALLKDIQVNASATSVNIATCADIQYELTSRGWTATHSIMNIYSDSATVYFTEPLRSVTVNFKKTESGSVDAVCTVWLKPTETTVDVASSLEIRQVLNTNSWTPVNGTLNIYGSEATLIYTELPTLQTVTIALYDSADHEVTSFLYEVNPSLVSGNTLTVDKALRDYIAMKGYVTTDYQSILFNGKFPILVTLP